MSALPGTLASYRRPLLSGRTIELRGRRLELSIQEARSLAECLYWSHIQGLSGLVAGMNVSEAKTGVRLTLPSGASGVIPRAIVLAWVEKLCRESEAQVAS